MQKHCKPFGIVLIAAALSLLTAASAHAYKVTRLKHLFDLEHGFLQPSDIAVGTANRIYVLDGVNQRVKVFNDSGLFLFDFGGRGSQPGEFQSPLGVTTDSLGRLYVADSGNRRIQIFNADGTYLDSFTVQPQKGDRPPDPVDVAVDETRQVLYVVDNDNHVLLVYSLQDYSLIHRWGSEGERMQEFRNPFFITVAKDTSVMVTDVLNTRVQVWTPNGKAVYSIGDYGVELGQLFRPKGVCVDKDNNVFISDSYVGAIQIFSPYGHFISVTGDEQQNILKWNTPVGITIDARQRLYVVEMIANRVRVYQILNTVKRSET